MLGLEVGDTLKVNCVDDCTLVEQKIYGTYKYTEDSSICKAAIHAGVMGKTKKGRVDVTMEKGVESYDG